MMIIYCSKICIFLMWFSIGAFLPFRIFFYYLIEDNTRKIRFIDVFVIVFSGLCGPFGFIGSILIIKQIQG
jgi:hypothetical protein